MQRFSARISTFVTAGLLAGGLIVTVVAHSAEEVVAQPDRWFSETGWEVQGSFLETWSEPFQPAEPVENLECAFFPETGHNLCTAFRAYWERFGGLEVHGFPISEEFVEPASGVIVQYFERQRIEWQAGTWPERFDVHLGRVGAEYLEWHRKPADAENPAAGTCGEAGGEIVTITANDDVPGPRCMFVRPDQRLEIVNEMPEQVRLALSTHVILLDPGERVTLDTTFDSFLEPGVHHAGIAPRYHAEIWLIDDEG